MMMLLAALLALAPPIAASVMIRLALRGHLTGEKPFCAECGFGLSGIENASVCPECGVGLENVGAIVRGERRIRHGLLRIGAAVLIVWIMFAVPLIWRTVAAGSWQGAKPVMLLRMEMDSNDRDANWKAANELARRVSVGALSTATERAVVTEALHRARGENRAQGIRWAVVLDAAMSSRRLTTAESAEYIAHSVRVRWHGTNEDFQSMAPPGVLLVFESRIGWSSTIGFNATIDDSRVDGEPVPSETIQLNVRYAHVQNASLGDTFVNIGFPGRAKGKTLKVTWRVKYFDQATSAAIAPDWVQAVEIDVGATTNPAYPGQFYGSFDRP